MSRCNCGASTSQTAASSLILRRRIPQTLEYGHMALILARCDGWWVCGGVERVRALRLAKARGLPRQGRMARGDRRRRRAQGPLPPFLCWHCSLLSVYAFGNMVGGTELLSHDPGKPQRYALKRLSKQYLVKARVLSMGRGFCLHMVWGSYVRAVWGSYVCARDCHYRSAHARFQTPKSFSLRKP